MLINSRLQTLSEIIPNTMSKIQRKYAENQGFLTDKDRRFLATSIIEYFFDLDIQLRHDTLLSLAKQIVQTFPSETVVWTRISGICSCN